MSRGYLDPAESTDRTGHSGEDANETASLVWKKSTLNFRIFK